VSDINILFALSLVCQFLVRIDSVNEQSVTFQGNDRTTEDQFPTWTEYFRSPQRPDRLWGKVGTLQQSARVKRLKL
jgi:hypothetical protein